MGSEPSSRIRVYPPSSETVRFSRTEAEATLGGALGWGVCNTGWFVAHARIEISEMCTKIHWHIRNDFIFLPLLQLFEVTALFRLPFSVPTHQERPLRP